MIDKYDLTVMKMRNILHKTMQDMRFFRSMMYKICPEHLSN